MRILINRRVIEHVGRHVRRLQCALVPVFPPLSNPFPLSVEGPPTEHLSVDGMSLCDGPHETPTSVLLAKSLPLWL